MYKEKLQKVIIESYLNDKMDSGRFIRMSEKVEGISEKRAKEIINEITVIELGLGAAISGSIIAYMRRSDAAYRSCVSACSDKQCKISCKQEYLKRKALIKNKIAQAKAMHKG